MLSPNPGISVVLEQLISVASLFPEDKRSFCLAAAAGLNG